MRVAFRLGFRGRRLVVEVRHQQATYTLAEGEPLEIVHHGESATVEIGGPLTLPIPPAPERQAPTQPAGRSPLRRRPPP